MGHVATTSYDRLRGQSTGQTDPNGKRTALALDALGRLTSVWLPDRRSTQAPSIRYGEVHSHRCLTQTRWSHASDPTSVRERCMSGRNHTGHHGEDQMPSCMCPDQVLPDPRHRPVPPITPPPGLLIHWVDRVAVPSRCRRVAQKPSLTCRLAGTSGRCPITAPSARTPGERIRTGIVQKGRAARSTECHHLRQPLELSVHVSVVEPRQQPIGAGSGTPLAASWISL
ncbi:RHS repeat domain-containing protein [Streptomyces sp. TRM68367]|uniref:RHS repeat domain-containing protein n=1 Tax=Streptomyces sp. TRM68367 TaxID=2758415 RepID=UPI00165C00C2|nr:RHS repeat protein [Streptomyces sp. TRM68367]